jgi:uncharacterized protein YndB with AHSA1/START domain
MILKSHSNQRHLNRIFDAPLEAVWESFTDPKILSKWWGPRGFSLITQSLDLQPCGEWIYTLRGSEEVDHHVTIIYRCVEPMKQLEYDLKLDRRPIPLVQNKMALNDVLGKTELQLTMTFDSQAHKNEKSDEPNFDRLDEYLYEAHHERSVFILTRHLEASMDDVFKMWISPTHVVKWQPPTGFNMEIIDGEIKQGARFFYSMANNDFKFYGRSTYLKIEKAKEVSFLQEFCNSKAENSKHPGSPSWPSQWQTTVSFIEEGTGRTKLTLLSEIIGEASIEERSAFVEERAGMAHGWNGSFDRLEDLLKS